MNPIDNQSENHFIVMVPKNMFPSCKNMRFEVYFGDGDATSDRRAPLQSQSPTMSSIDPFSQRDSNHDMLKNYSRRSINEQLYCGRWGQEHQSRHEPRTPSASPSSSNQHYTTTKEDQRNVSIDRSSCERGSTKLLAVQGAQNSCRGGGLKSYDFTPLELKKLHEAIRQGKTHSQAYTDFPQIGAAKFKSRFYRVKSAMAAQGLI